MRDNPNRENKSDSLNRRRVLQTIGIGAVATGFPLVGSASADGSDLEGAAKTTGIVGDSPDKSVAALAMEHEAHPKRPLIAFTSVNREEGFQLYLARRTDTADEVPDRIEQLTEAEHGVHAVSWESESKLRYSRDGATYEYTIGPAQDAEKQEQQVDSEPLPIRTSEGEVTTAAKVVKCTNVPSVGDWCIRVHSGDSGHTPLCTNNPTPPSMTHNHFSVYPQSDAKGGINLWAGNKSSCFYVGEEHYSGKCVRVCYDGNFPSLGAIADAYEEMILIAAAAAGITIGAAVVKALAYILAGLTVKTPVGLPV